MKPYPLPFASQEFIEAEVRSLLELGVIEHSTSPYFSPIVLIIDIVQYLYYGWTAPVAMYQFRAANRARRRSRVLAVVGQDRRAGLTGFRRS
ncbi:hypothetical protein ElyMa_003522000 [Elysia marginata]|uniref:Reverse transcriptase/retrotransposon-derived protein RNase H-like domain-containing protein n=1 Tax=Elysia marginata TaxID=1093978 RepID=A0AAV4EGC2_9GAST|nr:hypothetical protein ElyMa_003522000 [Elysia marginata]